MLVIGGVIEDRPQRPAEGAQPRGLRRSSVRRAAILLAAVALAAGAAVPNEQVVVVVESHASIYQQAALGFEEGFAEAAPIRRLYLDGPAREVETALDSLQRQPPRLVVSIGTQAARTAKSRLPGTALLYCLALRPAQNNLMGKNTGGVTLDVELSQLLSRMREAFPQLRRLGVVYNDVTSGEFVQRAEQGLPPTVQLSKRAARTPQEAARAIEDLMRTALGSSDAFWLLWDPVVANPANFRRLVELSLSYKVPLIAPARPFVEAGALLSIEPDYRKTGEQAGRMARQVLSGLVRLEDVRSEPPKEVVVTVNAEVARRLNIGFPAALQREVVGPP